MWIIVGDLKLVEKFILMIMVLYDFCNIKVNVKVVFIENGIMFGNIGKISEKILKKFILLNFYRKKRCIL